MRILMSGAGGFIGRALRLPLSERGDDIIRLVRHADRAAPDAIAWNPLTGDIDRPALEHLDAVIHLGGKNLGSWPWTRGVLQEAYDSRVIGTRNLCHILSELESRPRVLVCASATGYYGDRGDEELTEESNVGTGFLADLCRDWELACEAARQVGIRVVNLRIGIIMDRKGGALPRMLPMFRLGLGARLGDGRAWFPWVSLPDVIAAFLLSIDSELVSGPINVTAPNPVTNREFTQKLARVLHRPSFLVAPRFAVRILLGRMAKEGLLVSQKVCPMQLQRIGFEFGYPDFERELRRLFQD